MNKMTAPGKTPDPPRAMTAARADRDARPLTETDFKRMTRTPQAIIFRRALELRREDAP